MDSETVTYIVQLLHSNGLYAAEDALLRELEERCPEPAGMQPLLPDPPEHSAVTFHASVGLQQDHGGVQEQSTRQAVQDRWCSPHLLLCYKKGKMLQFEVFDSRGSNFPIHTAIVLPQFLYFACCVTLPDGSVLVAGTQPNRMTLGPRALVAAHTLQQISLQRHHHQAMQVGFLPIHNVKRLHASPSLQVVQLQINAPPCVCSLLLLRAVVICSVLSQAVHCMLLLMPQRPEAQQAVCSQPLSCWFI